MADETGFSTMGRAESAGEIAEIGIGMLGYAFMGEGPLERVPDARVHGLAAAAPAAAGGDRRTRRDRVSRGGPPLRVRARRHGLARPRGGPGGRPLRQRRPERPSRRADDRSGRGGQARHLREAARPRRGRVVRHLGARRRRRASCTCAPSTTASSRPCGSPDSCIESGELGEIHHFRGRYLQEWGATDAEAWRFEKEARRLGRARRPRRRTSIDLARYLVGEIDTVSALTATFQPGRQVDDAFETAVRFENGAVGTIEATPLRRGPEERVQLGDQRLEGLAGLRPRAAERAPDQRGRRRFPHAARLRGRRPVLELVVAPRPHDRLGAHLRARARPPPRRDRRRHEGGSARRHLRGRLPRLGGLRRDPPLRRDGPAPDGGVPVARRPMSAVVSRCSRALRGTPRR